MRKIDDEKILKIIDGLQEDNSLIASPAVWNGLMVIRKILEASCSEPKQAVSGSVDDTISRQLAIVYACSGSVRRMDDGDWRRVEDIRRDLMTMPSAQPNLQTTDCISRQDAIELAMQYCPDDDGTCSKADENIRNLLDELEALPSAQPDACENTCEIECKSNDMISRQSAIDAVKRLSLGETDATRLSMRIGDYLERLPSASPKYTELSPEDVAFELSPGDIDGEFSWYSTIMKLIQTGHVICRKENV